MRITVDTNILVSATFWLGDSNKIIEMIENKEVDLILSEEILNEFKEVLNYKEIKDKIKDKDLEMNRSIEKIESLATIIRPSRRINVVKEDPDDNKILECALAGKVDIIISKDNHLLKIKEYSEIKIIRPKEFLLMHKSI